MAKNTDTPRVRRVRSSDPAYPRRGQGVGAIDPSRRRFLRQCAGAAGGATLLAGLGLPRLSHGQSLEVDFAHLNSHPPNIQPPPIALAATTNTEVPVAAAVVAPAPAAQAPGASLAGLGGSNIGAGGAGITSSREPVGGSEVGGSGVGGDDLQVAFAEEVVENRALWVEPGYLVLLRWRRPDGDEADALIAALEGSVDVISAYFVANVTTGEDLHNLDRLHIHERSLVELLGPLVAPAVIEVLHLDHDCASVCPGLAPIGPPEDMIILGGAIAPTSFPE